MLLALFIDWLSGLLQACALSLEICGIFGTLLSDNYFTLIVFLIGLGLLNVKLVHCYTAFAIDYWFPRSRNRDGFHPYDHDEDCHPCPKYRGMFHHICSEKSKDPQAVTKTGAKDVGNTTAEAIAQELYRIAGQDLFVSNLTVVEQKIGSLERELQRITEELSKLTKDKEESDGSSHSPSSSNSFPLKPISIDSSKQTSRTTSTRSTFLPAPYSAVKGLRKESPVEDSHRSAVDPVPIAPAWNPLPRAIIEHVKTVETIQPKPAPRSQSSIQKVEHHLEQQAEQPNNADDVSNISCLSSADVANTQTQDPAENVNTTQAGDKLEVSSNARERTVEDAVSQINDVAETTQAQVFETVTLQHADTHVTQTQTTDQTPPIAHPKEELYPIRSKSSNNVRNSRKPAQAQISSSKLRSAIKKTRKRSMRSELNVRNVDQDAITAAEDVYRASLSRTGRQHSRHDLDRTGAQSELKPHYIDVPTPRHSGIVAEQKEGTLSGDSDKNVGCPVTQSMDAGYPIPNVTAPHSVENETNEAFPDLMEAEPTSGARWLVHEQMADFQEDIDVDGQIENAPPDSTVSSWPRGIVVEDTRMIDSRATLPSKHSSDSMDWLDDSKDLDAFTSIGSEGTVSSHRSQVSANEDSLTRNRHSKRLPKQESMWDAFDRIANRGRPQPPTELPPEKISPKLSPLPQPSPEQSLDREPMWDAFDRIANRGRPPPPMESPPEKSSSKLSPLPQPSPEQSPDREPMWDSCERVMLRVGQRLPTQPSPKQSPIEELPPLQSSPSQSSDREPMWDQIDRVMRRDAQSSGLVDLLENTHLQQDVSASPPPQPDLLEDTQPQQDPNNIPLPQSDLLEDTQLLQDPSEIPLPQSDLLEDTQLHECESDMELPQSGLMEHAQLQKDVSDNSSSQADPSISKDGSPAKPDAEGSKEIDIHIKSTGLGADTEIISNEEQTSIEVDSVSDKGEPLVEEPSSDDLEVRQLSALNDGFYPTALDAELSGRLDKDRVIKLWTEISNQLGAYIADWPDKYREDPAVVSMRDEILRVKPLTQLVDANRTTFTLAMIRSHIMQALPGVLHEDSDEAHGITSAILRGVGLEELKFLDSKSDTNDDKAGSEASSELSDAPDDDVGSTIFRRDSLASVSTQASTDSDTEYTKEDCEQLCKDIQEASAGISYEKYDEAWYKSLNLSYQGYVKMLNDGCTKYRAMTAQLRRILAGFQDPKQAHRLQLLLNIDACRRGIVELHNRLICGKEDLVECKSVQHKEALRERRRSLEFARDTYETLSRRLKHKPMETFLEQTSRELDQVHARLAEDPSLRLHAEEHNYPDCFPDFDSGEPHSHGVPVDHIVDELRETKESIVKYMNRCYNFEESNCEDPNHHAMVEDLGKRLGKLWERAERANARLESHNVDCAYEQLEAAYIAKFLTDLDPDDKLEHKNSFCGVDDDQQSSSNDDDAQSVDASDDGLGHGDSENDEEHSKGKTSVRRDLGYGILPKLRFVVRKSSSGALSSNSEQASPPPTPPLIPSSPPRSVSAGDAAPLATAPSQRLSLSFQPQLQLVPAGGSSIVPIPDYDRDSTLREFRIAQRPDADLLNRLWTEIVTAIEQITKISLRDSKMQMMRARFVETEDLNQDWTAESRKRVFEQVKEIVDKFVQEANAAAEAVKVDEESPAPSPTFVFGQTLTSADSSSKEKPAKFTFDRGFRFSRDQEQQLIDAIVRGLGFDQVVDFDSNRSLSKPREADEGGGRSEGEVAVTSGTENAPAPVEEEANLPHSVATTAAGTEVSDSVTGTTPIQSARPKGLPLGRDRKPVPESERKPGVDYDSDGREISEEE